MQLSISTKSILKEVFINYIKNKAIELPNNENFKETKFFDYIK
jgi:hypothetical protein